MEFAAKNLTMGQMNALVKKLGGEEGVKRFLAGTVEVIVKSVIELVASMTVKLTERVDPDAFYRTRPGLYVWDGFRTLVVAKAHPIDPADSVYSIESFQLTRDAVDDEIENSLSKSHLFGETLVCAVIAGLIAKQPKGEDGALLNNGYANIFYTGSCVVRVRWDADGRRWRVGAWRRDGGGWVASDRVFSLATEV